MPTGLFLNKNWKVMNLLRFSAPLFILYSKEKERQGRKKESNRRSKPLNRYEEMGSKVHVKGLSFDRERDILFIVMGEEGGEFR